MAAKSSGSGKASGGKPASNKNVRHVVPDKTAGDWKVKEPGNPKPTGRAPTQGKAEVKAKAEVRAKGGGQVVVHTPKGKIRDADTVKPGNESPKKDTKH